MIYIYIFLITVPLVYLFEYKLRLNVRVCAVFGVAFMLILLTGFRGPVDGDYLNYKDIYEKIKLSSGDNQNIIEPGYFLLNYFIINLELGFQFVLLIMAIFTIVPKLVALYNISENFPLSLLSYYSTVFFVFDFTQIRQAFAITLFIVSIKFIKDKKFIIYFLLILAATLFHFSALILMPCYFLFNRVYRHSVLYVIIAACAIISLFSIKINFLDLFSGYNIPNEWVAGKLNYYIQADSVSYTSIKQVFLALIFIRIGKKVSVKNAYANILLNIYVFGILLSTIVNQVPELSYRIKWYFLWTECILIVCLVTHFSGNNRLCKFLMYAAVMWYYLISLLVLLDNLSGRGLYIYPYRFVFEY